MCVLGNSEVMARQNGHCPVKGCNRATTWSPPTVAKYAYRLRFSCDAGHVGAIPYWDTEQFGVTFESLGLELQQYEETWNSPDGPKLLIYDGVQHLRLKNTKDLVKAGVALDDTARDTKHHEKESRGDGGQNGGNRASSFGSGEVAVGDRLEAQAEPDSQDWDKFWDSA